MRDAQTERERPTPDAHWITYAFYPWDEYTQAEVHLASRVGGVRGDLCIWSGHLGLGRRDLAGKSGRDVALMLGDELWRQWHDHAQTKSDHRPIGPGVPLGTTGGTVGQDPLPGL